MEIPVYLFTGFLEAGKTQFIQRTLENPQFNQGENTLLLLCEEGVEEYELENFPGKRVFVENIEEASELNEENLNKLCKKHACERVMVEYNGMWVLDALYDGMPEEWIVYQEFCFVDGRTFMSYNKNMRELVVDKIKSCEMLVFNRTPDSLDKEEVHKIVRAVNRRTEIAYEAADGSVVYDDIPDELPFDVNAPVIDIAIENFATWYRDLSEDMEKYQGKTVKVAGLVATKPELPPNSFIIGREMMTCCVDDLSFAGLLCFSNDAGKVKSQDWVEVEASIHIEDSSVYGRRGPVLTAKSLTIEKAPEDTVATFF